jgi:hypothetical protein
MACEEGWILNDAWAPGYGLQAAVGRDDGARATPEA